MTIVVAPREIVDYVERACRVQGVPPGDAGEIAEAIAFGEVHVGGALAAFLRVAEPQELTGWFRAIDRAALDVLDGAGRRVVEHDAPGGATPESHEALGASLIERWARGGVVVAVSAAACAVELRGAAAQAAVSPVGDRALRHGVELPDEVWSTLMESAKPFLVAEAELDAATD